jgi:threonine/homoserine/homoserine lactone efflux protein
MIHGAVMKAASDSDGGSPVFVLVLCFFLIMGVVQVVRPQLLWKANSRLQRGWVKDMNRVVGVIFLGFVTWMLVQQM